MFLYFKLPVVSAMSGVWKMLSTLRIDGVMSAVVSVACMTKTAMVSLPETTLLLHTICSVVMRIKRKVSTRISKLIRSQFLKKS